MEKSSVSCGQRPHALWLFSQFTEQYRKDECAGVVIRTVAFRKIRDAKNGMLEDSSRIGHPREMTQLQLRQFPWLLVERLRGKRFSRSRRSPDPRQLERAHIEPCHVAPDHLTAQLVSILANGMPAGVVAQQANHLAGYGRGVAKRHQHSVVFRQQFCSVPVRCRNYHFARTKRIGWRARGDLRFVEVRRDVKVCSADELLQIFKFYEPVVEDDVLLEFVLFGKDFEAEPVGFAMLA